MDDDLTEMLRNNPPDVVFSAFSQAFFKGAIKMFQRDNEMKNIVLSDPLAREQAIKHFFNRALREARESPGRKRQDGRSAGKRKGPVRQRTGPQHLS